MSRIVFSIVALLASASFGWAEIETFIVDDPGGRNHVDFASQAPIEQIVGATNAVTGNISFDPSDLKKPANGKITVDLRTLKTGIDLRDEHMRGEPYLNTNLYPEATFELNAAPMADLSKMAEGQPVTLMLHGKFTLHGVTRPISVTGKATYFKEQPDLAKMGYPGEMLNFQGSFTMKLADYNITRPQFLVLKLAEEVTININFTATTGRQAVPKP